MIADVGREAFRSAEEFLDTSLFKRWHSAHCVDQERFEMFEAACDFIKAEIFGNAVHPPRPRIGFECTDEQFARVIFVIAAIVVVAEHRQCGVDALDAFKQHIIMLARVEWCGNANARGQIASPHAAADHDVIGVD